MSQSQKIDFYSARDFGQEFNVIFQFLKANFIPLFKSVLYLAGPAFIITGLLFGTMYSSMFTLMFNDITNMAGDFDPTNFIWMGAMGLLGGLSMFASMILVTSVTQAYMQLYIEREEGLPSITSGEVWQVAKKRLGMITGTLLGYFALFFVPYAFFALLSFLISPFFFVGIFFIYFLIFYLYIALSVAIPARYWEGLGLMDGFKRSMYLIKGKWWISLLFYMVVNFAQSIISYIFIIPAYIVGAILFVAGFSMVESGGNPTSWIGIVVTLLAAFVLLGMGTTYAIPTVAMNVHFFSLREEKEGTRVLDEIQHINDPKPDENLNEGYF